MIVIPKILDRYIVGSVARPFLAVSLLLVSVFVAYSLARFLSEANEGVMDAAAVVRLTGLKSLIALEVLLPIALYIGFIVGLGRLYSDWEVVAVRASGISEFRLVLPALGVALLVAAGIAALSLAVRPWAYSTLYATEAKAEASTDIESLATGSFHTLASSGRTVFVGARDRRSGELDRIFLRRSHDNGIEVISASTGRLDQVAGQTSHKLTLRQALIYKHGGQGKELVARLGTLELEVPGFEVGEVGYRAKSASTRALIGSEESEDRAELQWRMSNGLSTFLLASVALPLGRTRPRSGRYARIVVAVVIYGLYYNVLGIVRSSVEQGTLDYLWWAPLGLGLVLLAVLFLQRRQAGV